jgi:hypothetical protein
MLRWIARDGPADAEVEERQEGDDEPQRAHAPAARERRDHGDNLQAKSNGLQRGFASLVWFVQRSLPQHSNED